jgi:hypothetical protein
MSSHTQPQNVQVASWMIFISLLAGAESSAVAMLNSSESCQRERNRVVPIMAPKA